MVSANFVIPYPPGFPIMVPGQVLTQETIDFMRKLDVKEIHGYEKAKGLKLLKADAVAAKRSAEQGSRRRGFALRQLTALRNREGRAMFEWFANTLRQYPEIAIFISLAFGYFFGSFTYKGSVSAR